MKTTTKKPAPKPSWQVLQEQRKTLLAKYGPILRVLARKIEASPESVLVTFEEDREEDRELAPSWVSDDIDRFVEGLCLHTNTTAIRLINELEAEQKKSAAKDIPRATVRKISPGKKAAMTRRERKAAQKRAMTRTSKPKSSSAIAKEMSASVDTRQKTFGFEKPKRRGQVSEDLDQRVYEFALGFQAPWVISHAINMLGISRSQASSALKRLMRAGKLKRQGFGRFAKYDAVRAKGTNGASAETEAAEPST